MCIRGNSFAPVSAILPLYIAAVLLNRLRLSENLSVLFAKQTLSNIYLTFIGPKLEYACEVWDGNFEREI
jgi:hypothetical protein